MQEDTGPQGTEATATQEAPAAETPVVDVGAAIKNLEERLASRGEEQKQGTESKTQVSGETQPAGAASTEKAAEVPAQNQSQEAEVKLTARQQAALFRQEQDLRRQREELKSQQGAVEAFRETVRKNPTEALKQLGIDNPADIAALVWHEALGENAPEEYKRQAQQRLMESKSKEVETKLEEYEKRLQTAVAEAQWKIQVQAKDDEIKHAVKVLPDEYRFLRRHAEKNPEAALQLFYDVARSQIEQNNFSFSALDIAKALNEELENEFGQFKDLLSESASPPVAIPVVDPRKSTKTLTNLDSSEKPSKQMNSIPIDSPEWTKRGTEVVQRLLAQKRK